MRTHELKTDPTVFDEVWRGVKKFEIRRNDRGFAVGDLLILKETKHTGDEMNRGAPPVYTGRFIDAAVTSMLVGPIYGLAEGWVIMSIGVERKTRS